MDDATRQRLARRLLEAERERKPVAPLTADHPGMTADDAYKIQEAVVAARLDAGDRIVGWKVGLTSRAMQEMIGVDQPDYGPVLASMLVADGGAVPYDELIQPKAEAEIAFVLDRPLEGPGVTPLDVLRATAGVVASIEVIDSRIEDWQIKLPDTVADLASSARVILSARMVPAGDLDLRLVGMVMTVNGEPVSTGAGAAALGNPLNAVAWAANTLGRLGATLDEGQIVMPGALHRAVDVEPGDTVRATFDRLGGVTVRFT